MIKKEGNKTVTVDGKVAQVVVKPDNKKVYGLELRSEEVHEILTRVPSWTIRYGNTIFFIIVMAILTISWIIRYPDVLTAETIVTTKEPPQKEYARSTGKIKSIFVDNLQAVEKNTVLAVLENTAVTEDVFFLKSVMDTVNLQNNDLRFPIDKMPALILGEVEPAFSKFENNYLAYDLNRKLNPYLNEATAKKVTLSELKVRLENLKSQFDINKVELDLKEKNLERNKQLYEKGVISRLDYESQQLELMNVQKANKILRANISQVREDIAGANKNVVGNEIIRTQEETKLNREMIQSFNQLKLAIKDWEYRYVLKSQIFGKVTYLNFWSNNQNVNQDDLVFTIIPDKTNGYVAKVKAGAQNSGKIKMDQVVNIKLENFPEAEFGMLKGKVTSISLVPDDKGFYLIDVNLPDELITTYGNEIEFKQEMVGSAEIITEDLRLLERLFYQFKTILDN
nr:HlyD family efflux transporter periplasmic adaptor subunit [Allomuricauda sp.]